MDFDAAAVVVIILIEVRAHNANFCIHSVNLQTFYHREARKCSKAKAYFAASVMQVAAFEAALQSMCFIYPNINVQLRYLHHSHYTWAMSSLWLNGERRDPDV